MTLIPCRECSQQISTQAPSCPHCGACNPAGTLTPLLENERARLRSYEKLASSAEWGLKLYLALLAVPVLTICYLVLRLILKSLFE